jgi:integrase
MKYSTHPLCRCTDEGTGKPLGQKCPKLHRPDGSWNPRHGSMGWAARIPTSGGTKAVKRYGYDSKAAASADAGHVSRLLDLAPDDVTRARIGDLITGTRRGAPLPAVEDVRRRLGLGLDPGQPGITVGQWMETWLAGKRRAKRASTVRMYESHTRIYISPVIGDLPLERVSTAHVEAVLAAVPGSAATRHRVLATLRGALNGAVRAHQITWNPCLGIEPLEPENPPEAQRWTPEQAWQFIEHVAGDPLGLAYRVMILNGCRRAELCGLRWAGADLEVPYRDPETGGQRTGAVLTVARTIVQLGGKIHEEPTAKSRAGNRLVFIDHDTAALLREHKAVQGMEAMLAGDAWADNDLVFCQPDGRPWLPDHISKKFKRLAAGAGVPVVKLHEGGRHTGNSLMFDAEVREDIVMRTVGHASREISQRYNHPMIEAHLAASHQVGALVRKAGGRT